MVEEKVDLDLFYKARTGKLEELKLLISSENIDLVNSKLLTSESIFSKKLIKKGCSTFIQSNLIARCKKLKKSQKRVKQC
jgi:hypothetical protein